MVKLVKTLLLLSFTFSMSFIALPSFAAKPKDSGIYVEGNAGWGKVNIIGAGSNQGFSGSLNLGYQLNPYFAIEGGFTLQPKVIQDSYYGDLAIKGILPIGDTGLDIFGKVGGAVAHAIGSSGFNANTGVVGFFGTGASYWLTENLAVTTQATATTRSGNSIPAMYNVTGGIRILF